jgi:ribonuclease P protein component
MGLVVSRKVGPSVLRNRFKRLAREVFRKSQARFPEDAEIVLIAKHWSKELREATMADEWSTAQDRILSALCRHRQKRARGAAC